MHLRAVLLASLLLPLVPGTAFSHGSVSPDDDLCIISVNFLRAHFTVFQPETRGTEEYCEDVPDVDRAVFVMEYLHELLNEMAIDFRIIRDVNDIGKFADWSDIEAMGDLEPYTVFYAPPVVEPGGYYRAAYSFEEKGTYIGVVTARHPTENRDYNAVFYFQVGGFDWGTLPLFLAIALLLQAGYWWNNRKVGSA